MVTTLSGARTRDSASTVRVGWGFIFMYALAFAGAWLALLTPVLVTIALRVRELTPDRAATNLSLVLGVGALFALIGNPLFGRLSDRTRSRWGMRRPWLVGGMLIGAAALYVIAIAPTIVGVLLGWCLAQLAFNAVLAAIVAVLPDQVPAEQRGTVSGVLGVCMPIGQVGGTFLVQAVAGSMVLMLMIPGVIGLVAVALFAIVLPDRRLPHAPQQPALTAAFPGSFWVDPRKHPDFAWAWLSRFLLVTGTAFLTTYQAFYLIDKLGHDVAEVPALIFKGSMVQAIMIVIASLISGRVSDALDRRKLFVLAAAAVYGVALWIIAAADSYTTFLIGMAITGLGQGVYFAVDLALVTQVLPNRERDAAKDLGIFNIANALPQSVAPALAPAVLSVAGGDYTWLYVVAGAISLLGSVAIFQVRSVR
ncbi:MAG: MFS transporter [Steroidobacter sp.]